MAKHPGQFKKGQSGNPGGRPKLIAEVRDLARKHTTTAINRLAYLCEHAKNEAVQRAAAEALLDRGWGRPAQGIRFEDEDGKDRDLMPLVQVVIPDNGRDGYTNHNPEAEEE